MAEHDLAWWLLVIPGGLLVIHFLVNIILNFNLGVSKVFNRLESILVGFMLILYAWMLVMCYKGVGNIPFD
ncbi:MAG: hypothetical protein IPH31_24100 [Lewinellaceae bacterium]|nr:hypothetical protein [Lewinellaceae bacterium]